jgi:hypothetical protein
VGEEGVPGRWSGRAGSGRVGRDQAGAGGGGGGGGSVEAALVVSGRSRRRVVGVACGAVDAGMGSIFGRLYLWAQVLIRWKFLRGIRMKGNLFLCFDWLKTRGTK